MKSLLAIAASLLASTLASLVLAQPSWTVQHSGILGEQQVVLAAVDANVCWGVTRATGSRSVTRTTNGGTSWVASNHDSLNQFISIAAVNAETAWISATGAVYRTTNGGVNWTRQLTTIGNTLIVRFFDSNNGVCIGDGTGGNAAISTTMNGGTAWTPVPSSDIPLLQSEGFIPANSWVVGNTIWVPTNGGSLYKSRDRGRTWSAIRSVVNIGGFYCAFKDTLNGLLSGSLSATVKRTTDGGVTWDTTESKPQGISTLFMSYIPGTIGSYMITAGTSHGPFTGSAYTLNNGATWTIVDHELHGKAAFVSPRVGWSWGGADTIYKWTGRALPVREASSQLADHFELHQNYPNPFNPSTKIGFRIQVSGFTTLKVYDGLGREVRTLVNEALKGGSYEATFSAEGLASGVYFYRLRAGDFVETKRLLLLK